MEAYSKCRLKLCRVNKETAMLRAGQKTWALIQVQYFCWIVSFKIKKEPPKNSSPSLSLNTHSFCKKFLTSADTSNRLLQMQYVHTQYTLHTSQLYQSHSQLIIRNINGIVNASHKYISTVDTSQTPVFVIHIISFLKE